MTRWGLRVGAGVGGGGRGAGKQEAHTGAWRAREGMHWSKLQCCRWSVKAQFRHGHSEARCVGMERSPSVTRRWLYSWSEA